MVRRPGWWPDWIPETCPDGHPLLPGRVSTSWVHCECPAAGDAQGHHVWYCAPGARCDHHWIDPAHEGELPGQR